MEKCKVYSQEAKDELLTKFMQSGLTQTKFCELPEVPITTATLCKWLNRDVANRWEDPVAGRARPAPAGLNIVCYNVGENARKQSNGGDAQEPTLQQMVAFQQEVHELCIHLYRLGCSKESITLLRRIKEVL